MKISLKQVLLLLIMSSATSILPIGKNEEGINWTARQVQDLEDEKDNKEFFDIEFPQKYKSIAPLNINEDEHLTCESFSELINQQAKFNKPFILARVTTQKDNLTFVHYLDAHYLHAWLFQKYQFPDICPELINPINNQKITHIQYFTISKGETSFQYLCSLFDFFYGNRKLDLLNYFYSNSDEYKHLAKEIENKEKNELAKPPSIKSLEYPKSITEGLSWDISKNDFFTHKSFSELILNQQQANESFILAKVTIKKNDKDFISYYYDAHALNKRLFGPYPIQNFNKPLLNPINKHPIHTIEYFTFDQADNNFKYLCSYFDLLNVDNSKELLNYFYLNSNNLEHCISQYNKYVSINDYPKIKQYAEILSIPKVKNVNLKIWASATYNLGEIYYFGPGLDRPNYQKAKEFFELVSTPEVKNVNLQTWALATCSLGNIYHIGQGLDRPDYQKAKEFYELVSTSEVKNVTLRIWSIATCNLGNIYYNGRNLDRPDYQKAKEFYELVSTPEVKGVNLSTWASATCHLGQIYYFGHGLDKPNYQKGKELLELVSTPDVKNVNLGVWFTATHNLGEIYYFGRGLDRPNYQKAKELFELVSTPQVRNINLGTWAIATHNLGEIYYFGRGLDRPNYQKAKELFELISTPQVRNVVLNFWASATFNLGQIYYFGDGLDKPNYKKAKELFELASTPDVKNVNLEVWQFAKTKLEKIEKLNKEKSSDSVAI